MKRNTHSSVERCLVTSGMIVPKEQDGLILSDVPLIPQGCPHVAAVVAVIAVVCVPYLLNLSFPRWQEVSPSYIVLAL